MHTSIKNYAISGEAGARLSVELRRVAALTGTDLRPSIKEGNSGEFAQGFVRQSAMLREGINDLNFMVLRYGSSIHTALMTPLGYEMIRRPELQLLESYTIKQVLQVVAGGDVQLARNAQSRDGLYPVTIDRDVKEAAARMLAWLELPANTSGMNKEEREVARCSDLSLSYILGKMSPSVFHTLGAMATHKDKYDGTWGWDNRSAWEELRVIAQNQYKIREINAELEGTIRVFATK